MDKKSFILVILFSTFMLISPLAGITLATNPYTDPTALAWNVDASFNFMDMIKANHTYVPADKVANPVQKLYLSYDEKLLTCDIKVGGVTYSLGKDFTYTGHVDYIYYNPSFANPTLGYYYPSVFSSAEATVNYMYNFSAVPGGLEGTLSMLATSKDSVSSIVSVGGTGDFKNTQVKATISPQWYDAAKMVVNIYHDGMVSGWPNAVPAFMTSDTGVTYAQLTDKCINEWGLSSNPFPTFPAGVPTQYLIFNVVIGDKFYLGVSCNSYTGAYDPVSKTATVIYNATWYLDDWYKGVAEMDQGFKGTVVFTLLNYTPANATATPPTPATYTVGPGVFNLQGFGALTGQNMMLRADGSVTPILAKGYAVDRGLELAVASWTINTPVSGGWVFAAVKQSQNPTIGNQIFVNGYHPPGSAGPSAKYFSGWATCDKFEWSMDHVTAKATMMFTVITTSPAGVNTTSTVQHIVEIIWTATNPATLQGIKQNMNGVALDVTGMSRSADATITITKSSTSDHSTWTTSNAFVGLADNFSMVLP
jgi:hypothetical protein